MTSPNLLGILVFLSRRKSALHSNFWPNVPSRRLRAISSRLRAAIAARVGMLDGLARALAQRQQRRIVHRPRQAAILLPLLSSGPSPSLLLTRRSQHLSSHKGQVAFPGGRAEPSDGSAACTALREAFEEVGLRSSDVNVLGMLDDIPSFKNDTTVTPVVAWCQPHIGIREHLRANADEVDRIFEVPLTELCDGDRWEVRAAEWRGQQIDQYYFQSQGETLWGLSAYATLMLLALVPGSRAPVPKWFKC